MGTLNLYTFKNRDSTDDEDGFLYVAGKAWLPESSGENTIMIQTGRFSFTLEPKRSGYVRETLTAKSQHK